MENPEISLYTLVARNRPQESYNLLHEYGLNPKHTFEALEEGLRHIVRNNKETALKQITALHPHIALFQTYPDVLGLPPHKEKEIEKEVKVEEKFNACGCMGVDGSKTETTNTAAVTAPSPDLQQQIFTPTNIAIIGISTIAAIVLFSIFKK